MAEIQPLRLEDLTVRDFRNLALAHIAFGERFNVIAGENGQGKTNLLEAIYVACTSKSFRATRPGELVALGRASASVRAVVREGEWRREQTIGLRSGARLARIDGKRPATLASYAVRTPVVVFHPGEMALSLGAGSERRRVLDRIALYNAPVSASELESYQRAVRERQRALETRGPTATDLDHWEELIVRHGRAVMNHRAEAAARLGPIARAAFARFGSPGLAFEVEYAPSAPWESEVYRHALAERRSRDHARGAASLGPHRDELRLALDGKPMRGIASQGQHRAAVLALKSGELEVVATQRGVRPILLLDDVSSELDRSRTQALFEFLWGQEGQVFLTTTRPDLIETGPHRGEVDRIDLTIAAGVLLPAGGAPDDVSRASDSPGHPARERAP